MAFRGSAVRSRLPPPYTSTIRYKVGKAKDVFNNPNDIEFQTLKKCINEGMVTTGDWERLTGQERDLMD